MHNFGEKIMPYIKEDKRQTLDPIIDQLHRAFVNLEADDESNNMEGNLNYVVTRLLRMIYGTSYSEIHDAMGVLLCVALEHYRTIAAPYQDQKKFDNGDVDGNVLPTSIDEIVVEETSNVC